MTFTVDDRRFLVWLCLAVALITSAPYVAGVLITPKSRTYTGIHSLTPGDVAIYYSFIEQGRQGKAATRNLYTGEPQDAAMFTPQWFILGQFANLFHLSNVAIYQLARVVFGTLFLILTYAFITPLLPRPQTRKLTMVVIAFATGFGALVPITDMTAAVQNLAIPVDQWVPEAFPFLTLYHNPLFLMALCLLLGVLIAFERSLHEPRGQSAWVAAGLATILAVIHPYDVVILTAVIAALLFIHRLIYPKGTFIPFRLLVVRMVQVLVLPITALVAMRFLFFGQPALEAWVEQNITISPDLWWYLPAYLLPIIVAIFGVRHLRRVVHPRAVLVLAWAAVVPLLVYLPHFPYQRRMLEGWFIPLTILGALGVERGAAWLVRTVQRDTVRTAIVAAVASFAIVALFVTSLNRIFVDTYYATFRTEPTSIPRGLAEAFTWLRDHTSGDPVILARPLDANLFPGWSGLRVYYGQGSQTFDFDRKIELGRAFLDGQANETARQFVSGSGITQAVVRRTDTTAVETLQHLGSTAALVYQNDDALVYTFTNSTADN
ncbi:MAG: hypothetical protein Q8O51_01375 [bacterium]|nr:hypothetical protein [bacterium]